MWQCLARSTQCRRAATASLIAKKPTRSASNIIFSGIQPTGIPHLGNYLGALREWVRIQNNSPIGTQLYFSLVDLHAITIQQTADTLRQWKRESLAILLAIGLDPTKSTLFFQSDVGQHSELMWILSCLASTGKLDRMTQWKDKTDGKTARNADRQKLGLYAYPVLQAADILLYRATHVPVGEDQAQHLELSRELANTFNHHVGVSWLIPPQTLISPASRVMSLTHPTSKMSKSDSDENSRIQLTDSESLIRSKIKGAKTDSFGPVSADLTDRAGVTNLLEILLYTTQSNSGHDVQRQETSLASLAAARVGMSLKDLKDEVSDAVVAVVNPIRARYVSIIKDNSLIETISQNGAQRAREQAVATLEQVKALMGLSL